MNNINKTLSKKKIENKSKVLETINNTKNIKNRLKEQYKNSLEDFSENLKVRSTDCVINYSWTEPTNKELHTSLIDFQPEWDIENTSWESGYLRWVEVSINSVSPNDNIDKKKDTISSSLLNKNISELSLVYSEKFLNDELDDVDTIYEFINELSTRKYFWLDEEIACVWNKPEEKDNWVIEKSFDIFYNLAIEDRTYYISVEYIEYMNEVEWIEEISRELVSIAERVSEHMDFLNKNIA